MRVKIFWYSILFVIVSSGLYCRYLTWGSMDEISVPVKVYDKWPDPGGTKCRTNCVTFRFAVVSETDPSFRHNVNVEHNVYDRYKVGDTVYFTFEKQEFYSEFKSAMDLYGFLVTWIGGFLSFIGSLYLITHWLSKRDLISKPRDFEDEN